MMFCCDGLKLLIQNAGQQGMSVLVYQTSLGFRFNIQSRAFTREDKILLMQPRTPLPIKGNMSITANIGLGYCPVCGTKLQKLVTRSTIKQFQALAEQHKSFDQSLY
jgi:hypothetical protein